MLSQNAIVARMGRDFTVRVEDSLEEPVLPALPFNGDAYRVVYAVRFGADLWVVHAFQKKSTQGIMTPKYEVEAIKQRLKKLKERLR